jgi:PmbA protein
MPQTHNAPSVSVNPANGAQRFDSNPLERLQALITAAKAAGADACEVALATSRSLGVSVRKGEVETVERDENCDLGLRVMIGKRQAVVSVSEFSPATLERLIERAVAMARVAPEDDYIGLADPALLYRGKDDESTLDLYDPTTITAEAMRDRALACEAAGVAVDERLTPESASAGYSTGDWHILTSDGFHGQHKTSLFYQSARLIATDADGAMERDSEGRSKRHLLDLPAAEITGRIAGERAIRAMGARKIDTQTAPVVFEARVAKSLIGQFIGAISGPSVARGSSFLKDKLGEQVFASHIQLIEDPFRARGLSSCLYDDEGVAVSLRHLVKDGVATTWLLNSAAAKQLGMTSTGHASRSLAGPPGVGIHNVVLSPGEDDQATLIRNAGKGLLVTSMFGPSVNSDTGDWSAGASGMWFENGEIQYPVNEITVAGNLIEIFARLIPGSDLDIRGSFDTPSILVDALSLGGK